ncbi:hypothetical protein GFS31_18610 [Leptolyngbya sp. BL0902]|uniref:hypothetical protein n=1 Tax=Leptolyngbya sp. BL0902 TaxID=1115757 RepID=UPI00193642DC|nr:hypothetical protein [Leptolyngbya sp. BL0902]QQE65176.1 hypothetical protein GFS31_18610 [Leptolyngbya sp. BL0902]
MTESVSIESSEVSAAATGALAQDLQEIATAIDAAAQGRKGDSVALLALLRLLEQHHRDICETLFRDSLPSNRHTLYTLLRDIEVHGGWPYIQRMKLRSFLANYPHLEEAAEPDPPAFPPEEDSLDEDCPPIILDD